MRQHVLLVLMLIALAACGQNKHSKLTVVMIDDQGPNFKVTIDTLLINKEMNFSSTPIDLSFSCKNFHLPYYVPSGGIFKNAIKDKECDIKIYPTNIKCYEYDDKKRVVSMTVNGSGTMNNFNYKYNEKNQIVEIADRGVKFILTYNAESNLSQITLSDGIINKKLVFIYD